MATVAPHTGARAVLVLVANRQRELRADSRAGARAHLRRESAAARVISLSARARAAAAPPETGRVSERITSVPLEQTSESESGERAAFT